MSPLFYVSNKELHHLENGQSSSISCQAVDQFKKNLNEIQHRKKWKTQGSGAQFMGTAEANAQVDHNDVFPTDAAVTQDEKLIYSARLDDGSAIYIKSLHDLHAPESLVLRNTQFVTHDLDFDASHQRLVLSVSGEYDFERHLCILEMNSNRVQYLTEGECQDANPSFNPLNPDQIYYDSCGLAYAESIKCGPKEICLLDLKTGELENVMGDAAFDFFKPHADDQGNLYFLRKPYQNGALQTGSIFKDLILAPVRIIKAIIGWLDFFTQRYAGESLKNTSGANPAKSKQKTEEEIFVEGNLIKAHKNLEKNKSAGEKYPGFIPDSWQLMCRDAAGEVTCIKKGVMGYAVKAGQVYYSNGRHLIALNADKTESKLAEAKLISKIML